MSPEPSTLPDGKPHLVDVVLAYLQEVDAGHAPDPSEVLARHPNLTEELKAFFADQGWLTPVLAPVAGPAPPRPRSKAEPRSFGDYELLEEIARGGMGVVYQARQISLNRIVALKLILAGQLASPTDVQRFRTEAENAASLDHPHIVPIYEVGEHDGQHYFSMKLVEGSSLAQHVSEFIQTPGRTAQLLATIARAVHYAHQCGILHRDLKPANILLDAAGEPHVTDFGLAKRLEGGSQLTLSNVIVGTPSYMAPEQAYGPSKRLTTAVDVYALGAILYELLTAQPPFQAETPQDILTQVVDQAPVSPRRWQPGVPRDLEVVCLKCLQKDPLKRYASAGDLAEDLRRYLEGEPILARPTPAWEQAVKWGRRRPALAALLGVSVAAVFALLIGGWLYERRVGKALDTAVAERIRADEEKSRAEQERDAANKARDEAETARIAANKARGEAETARIAAKRERDRASRHFEDALAAVGLVNRLGQEQSLVDAPRTEKLRRDLLERALPFYERFLEVKSDDLVVRAEAGQAFLRVGDISEMLAQPQKAEEAYQRAVGLFQGLVTEHQEEPEYRRQLASCYNNLGILLATFSGRQQEAEHAHQRALELRIALVARYADNPDYRLDLARSYNNRGNFRQVNKGNNDADEDYRDAVKVLEKLVEDFKGQPDYIQELARTHVHRATLQTVTRSPYAEQTYQTALDLQRQLVAEHPRPEYQKELARILVNYGVLLQLNQRLPEAEKASAEAIATLENLTGDFSSVLDYRHLLGMSYDNLEILLKKRQRWPEAENACRKAIAVWERLAKELPGEPFARQKLGMNQNDLGFLLATQFRSGPAEIAWRDAAVTREKLVADFATEPKYWKELSNTYTNLTVLLTSRGMLGEAVEICRRLVVVQRKRVDALPNEATASKVELGRALNRLADLCVQRADHAEAAKTAAETEQLFAPVSAEYAQAAACLGRCMRLADKDMKLTGEKRKELVRKYGDLTVEMLRKAAAAGSKEMGDVKDNPGFDLLRVRDDFKKLSADLGAGAKGGTP